jgi:NADH-quinone oxidoreductase subunit C
VTPAELADRLSSRYPDVVAARGEVSIVVEPSELLGTLVRLRDDPELQLDFLANVAASDWPERSPRFWISYDLYSIERRHRLRVKVGVPEDDPHVPSVVEVYPGANWHERENFDFYGIVFDGHPDLTRILMPEGWDGFPLRKDEELGGVNTRYKGAFIPPVDRRTP